MGLADWIVLVVTLVSIIAYGIYKSKHTKDLNGYFLGNRSMPGWLILLSIMGTQASAITFISAPGQAYTDGMRFVQYYFGLPIAMIVISAAFVPIYHRLKVYTAYEFLESRFDLKTRTLTSFLFLISRGLSTGISIYAPAIILSSLLGWNIYLTNLIMGGLLIIYTVAGGAKAVAYTQQLQFIIIMVGMFMAAYIAVNLLPDGVGFIDALKTGGQLGKLNIITSGNTAEGFNWNDRYNMWSGVIGGFFLALSYFGTDQSQVGRYLTAKNEGESRIGLLLNGLVKVPMQFLILLVGVMVFAFYQFQPGPVFFNQNLVKQASSTAYAPQLQKLDNDYQALAVKQRHYAAKTVEEPMFKDSMVANEGTMKAVRAEYKTVLAKAVPGAESNDTNYIFLYFVLNQLPAGLVGLLIAVIIIAAWGSIAAALNSLSSATVVDIHQKFINKNTTDAGAYKLSWVYTLVWGLFSIGVAMFATNMGSLIEAVNILGSIFYGVILGVFLVAFFLKKLGGNAVFWSAVISQVLVIVVYNLEVVSFLWLNLIGAVLVIGLAFLLQGVLGKGRQKTEGG